MGECWSMTGSGYLSDRYIHYTISFHLLLYFHLYLFSVATSATTPFVYHCYKITITGDLSCNLITGPFLFLLSFLILLSFLSLLSLIFWHVLSLLSMIRQFSFLSPLYFGSPYLSFLFGLYLFYYINHSHPTCNSS